MKNPVNLFFLVFFVYLFATGNLLTFINFAYKGNQGNQGITSSGSSTKQTIDQQLGLVPNSQSSNSTGLNVTLPQLPSLSSYLPGLMGGTAP
jgi:hypothetical protein